MILNKLSVQSFVSVSKAHKIPVSILVPVILITELNEPSHISIPLPSPEVVFSITKVKKITVGLGGCDFL